jgi:hypothetical protein
MNEQMNPLTKTMPMSNSPLKKRMVQAALGAAAVWYLPPVAVAIAVSALVLTSKLSFKP